MRMRAGILAVMFVAACGVAACGKKDESVCAKYADFEVRCGDIPKDEAEMTRSVAKSFCEAARKEKDDNGLSAMIAQESECAKNAKSCEDYKACTEKLKPDLGAFDDDDDEATPVTPPAGEAPSAPSAPPPAGDIPPPPAPQ